MAGALCVVGAAEVADGRLVGVVGPSAGDDVAAGAEVSAVLDESDGVGVGDDEGDGEGDGDGLR